MRVVARQSGSAATQHDWMVGFTETNARSRLKTTGTDTTTEVVTDFYATPGYPFLISANLTAAGNHVHRAFGGANEASAGVAMTGSVIHSVGMTTRIGASNDGSYFDGIVWEAYASLTDLGADWLETQFNVGVDSSAW